MSEQFETSYKNLEYVGIRNIGYHTTDTHKVLKLYAAVLEIDNLDELVTVIDLKRQCETKDSRKYMSEIAKCLQNYTPERCKQVYYIQDIRLTIRTMKMKDLHGFEMVNDSIEKTNQRFNHIQSLFTNLLIRMILFNVNTHLNRFAYVIVTEYLLEKMKQCEEKGKCEFDFDLPDCIELKRMILKKFSNADFVELAIDKKYKSVIGSSKRDFSSKMVDETVENFLRYQVNSKLDHFDPLTIRIVIQDLYGKGFENLLTKSLRIGYEKITEKIHEVDELVLFITYKEYAVWLKKRDYATEIFPRITKPEGFVDEFGACYGKLESKQNYINIAYIATTKDFYYSSNLFRFKDEYKIESLKIIINQTIAEDNYPLLLNVIDSIISENIKHQQSHFYRIGEVTDSINQLLTRKRSNLTFQNLSYCRKIDLLLLQSCLLVKRKDDEQIDKLHISFDLDDEHLETGRQPAKIIASVKNFEKYKIVCKRTAICLTVDNSFAKILTHRNTLSLFKNHKTVIVTIKCDILTVNFYFKTYKDKNSIKFKGVKFAETEKRPLWLQERKDILAKSFSKCQNLASLIQYIQDVRFMPYCSSLIDLYIPGPKNFGVEVFSLTVISDTPCNLNGLVSAKLDDCQSTIEKFYIGREGTSTVKLQILMSDYLNRKVSDGRQWHKSVEQFIIGSGIKLSFLKEILDRFIYDENQFDASNEHDIAGVKTCDYKIYVCAILRDNRKAFVSVFGKEIYTSFEYCPMSKLLDIYAELVKDPEYLNSEHPLNMLHSSLGTPVHPIAYMCKVLSYPKSNLIKLLDMNLSHPDNIKTYKDLGEQIAYCIHADMAMENSTANGTETDSNVEKPSIASMQEILNTEMHNLIVKIKQHRDEINLKTKIRVAICSSDNFDSEDEKEIDELKSILLQEE